ncbi:MAG: efflux RND transporter periplasmic adaptor subunit [Steroidobacteraceae bacterium]
MTRGTLILGLLAFSAALAAYLLFGGSLSGDTGDDDAGTTTVQTTVSVQVGMLAHRTLHQYVEGYGQVLPAPPAAGRPAGAATVAPAITGVIAKVDVVPGEHVSAGQLLVELDSSSVTELFAQREVARQKRLYAQRNTSLKALQSAEAQLALLQVAAPLSGVVVNLSARPGEAVDPSRPLLEIIDLRHLIVQVAIPQAQASELRSGQAIELLTKPPLNARLTYISPTVDPSDGSVTVWGPLPARAALRPGQFVMLRIVTAVHADTLAAPSESVITDPAGQSTLSLVQGDEAVRTAVQTGLREGQWVEVHAPGLHAGDRIVTNGAYGLPARTRIEVTRGAGATTAGSTGDAGPAQ